MASKQSWWTLILLIPLLILTGSLTRPVRAQLSIEQEKKMGEQFIKAARLNLRLIEDPEVLGFTNTVGQTVVDHLEVHTFPYHFYVVDSDALNAFAAPAGHVFINRGLIEIMESEAELAAILGHEVAHVQSRHISQRLARAKKLNLATIGGLLAGIFLGGEAGAALIAGSQAGGASAQLNYSRQDEEEADRKGLRYVEAAGYPSAAIVSIMKKMGQRSWQAGGRIPTYLSTHPGVPERVNYLSSIVETRQHSSSGFKARKENPLQFKLMKAKLLGSYQNPGEAQNYFREWLENPETEVMAYYGMGLVLRRQGKMGEAVKSFRTAISIRPDLTPFLVELGDTYFRMGELEKAVSVLESALSLEPNQPIALYLMGRTLLEQGNAVKAREYLAKAVRLNNRLASVHYHLGMAYGQLERLDQAHYYFGVHHKRRGSWPNAKFHFQEALRRTSNPELREAILKEQGTVEKGLAEARKEKEKRRLRR